jgi:hypothetical protein
MKKRHTFNKHRHYCKEAMNAVEESRNSDWVLLFTALEQNGVELSESQRKSIMKSGINMHTLIRERQRIQSSGELLPTNPEVIKKRRLLQEEYREEYKP